MADKKISQLTNITGADVVDSTDELAIVDASTNETKAITREELFKSVGGATFNGNVSLGDNDELRFGDSDDLVIKYNGTNGTVTNDAGHLYLTNTANDNDVVIQSDDGSGGTADYFRADGSTGQAKLFSYGAQKLTTHSWGAEVTGAISVSGSASIVSADPYIALTDTDTGVDHEIDANSGVGNLVIHTDVNSEGSDPKLLLKVAGTDVITVRDTGNVDISNDLGVGGDVNISGSASIVSADPYIALTDTDTGVDHNINAASSVGNLVFNTDINSEGSDPTLLLRVQGITGVKVKRQGDVDITNDLSVGGGVVELSNMHLNGLQVTIASDAFATITPTGRYGGFLSVVCAGETTTPQVGLSGYALVDFGTTPSSPAGTQTTGSDFDVYTSGPPTGTTGTDSNVGLFLGGTSGSFYIENRRSSSSNFQITLF